MAAMLRSGTLRVSATDEVHWEEHGVAGGPAVLWCHGGPGSGLGAGRADAIRSEGLRVIGLDQRGCGRSRPLAADPAADLDANTTSALVADLEAVREHLGVDAWVVSGQSWGTTLALAYAQAHPERVRGIALAAVTTTSTREVEWITEADGMARVFPAEWEAFAAAVQRAPGERVVDAYARALRDPDRREDAARSWCAWEDVHVSLAPGATPSPRFRDAAFRLNFATLVTHYWSHNGFGGDDLLPSMTALAGIPGVLIHGRFDVSSPLDTPWRLHRAWPGSDLVGLPEGHGGPAMTATMREAVAHLTA